MQLLSWELFLGRSGAPDLRFSECEYGSSELESLKACSSLLWYCGSNRSEKASKRRLQTVDAAMSFLKAGATLVPSSSMARINFACGNDAAFI